MRKKATNIKHILAAGSMLAVAVVTAFAFGAKDAIVSAASIGSYELVSVNNTGDGQGGNGNSGGEVKMSANGRYVAFRSSASNLVTNDTNGIDDIFVRDLKNGTTVRASVSTTGAQLDDSVWLDAISPTGRYVAYRTMATTLEQGPYPNANFANAYLHDIVTGTNTWLINDWDIKISSISSDGVLVFGQYTPPNMPLGVNYHNQRAMVYDTRTSAWSRLSVPVDGVENIYTQLNVKTSCDGSFAVFDSIATNLTPNDTNGVRDAFLVDLRRGGGVTNITQGLNGASAASYISCNGDYMVISSSATNIEPLPSGTTGAQQYLYNRVNGTFSLINRRSDTSMYVQVNIWGLTDDGRVIFTGKPDSSSPRYCFTKDEGQASQQFSCSLTQPQALAMDKDGKKFVVTSSATNLIPSDTNGFTDVFASQINY